MLLLINTETYLLSPHHQTHLRNHCSLHCLLRLTHRRLIRLRYRQRLGVRLWQRSLRTRALLEFHCSVIKAPLNAYIH